MALHAAAQRPGQMSSAMSARSTRASAIARSGLTHTAGRRPMRNTSRAACAALAEDGLDPPVYRVDDLARQAAALEQARAVSAIDAAAFDVASHPRPDVLPPPAPRPGEPSRAWISS